MLRAVIIEESTSPWSGPTVIVPKPDHSTHQCNDFQRLNQVPEFDSYPRVDDLIKRLGRARFISTLDLTKGYWQVTLIPDAKSKMAHWQYWVISFGLHGVPAQNMARLLETWLKQFTISDPV